MQVGYTSAAVRARPNDVGTFRPHVNYATSRLATAFVAALAAFDAYAQTTSSASDNESAIQLPDISVETDISPRSAAREREARTRVSLGLRAGGTSLLERTEFAEGRTSTLSNVMAFAPAVFAPTRHEDEARLSIRGSGIQRGFLLRGLALYQDGIPLNHADGSGDFQSIAPLAAQYVDVWRSANALEYGANTPGGTVNFVSPTGRTAPLISTCAEA
ncbi:TonB-dependent receptor plug domain-containing protein [Achromobacter kerstersii]|nr:TonB-dependent receptor plug domain-containing protein [Achromobacter kerstersii]